MRRFHPDTKHQQKMKTRQNDSQYSTGLSRRHIEQALIAAGKDLSDIQPADLGVLEDFVPWAELPPAS